MGKPDYSGQLERPPPLSEIVPGLYQGQRPDSYQPWNLVVSCEEHLARKPMNGYEGAVIHVPFVDDDEFPLARIARQIEAAALAVVYMVENGGSVLVQCTGGLNRSSLVTVEALHLLGWERHAAVRLLRARRDPFCLCNRAFERWALREVLPTAAFRVPPAVPNSGGSQFPRPAMQEIGRSEKPPVTRSEAV